MTRIGVTGPQQMETATVARMRAPVNQVLGERAGERIGVTSLAPGAYQLFSALVLVRGCKLEVMVPFPEYRDRAFTSDHYRARFNYRKFQRCLVLLSLTHCSRRSHLGRS